MSTTTAPGIAEIGFARRGGTTRLVHLHQGHPLRVLFPTPADGEPALAALVTTSGGLVGGDRLAIAVRLEAAAAAHVTASAAEKIYRSLGATTEIDQTLTVETAGWLEFLPQETILFDGARLRRETRLELAPGAGFLGGDIVVFGRRARGERFTRGFFHEGWQVRRGGQLVWGDALHLDDDIAEIIEEPACFGGAAGFASMIFAPAGKDPERFVVGTREALARHAGPTLRAGASAVAGVLVLRWLGWDAAVLRRAFADLACYLRAAAMGLPARLPRLWHV